jgi:transcriptional regulator with XRE-family HTH domain
MDEADRPGFAPRDPLETARVLGASLARLRRQRGLTGQQLGRLAGMSQAKVSKIENGAVEPTAADVERLARALQAPDEVVDDLVDHANTLHNQFTDFRLTVRRLTAVQQDIARDEERATRIAAFQVAIVPGLLQTTEYARAILSEVATVLGGTEPGAAQPVTPSALTMRIQRQEVLYDRRKRFDLVIAESVLARAVGGPAEMLAQLERIRTVNRQDNVHVAVLPQDADLNLVPEHGFQLFDDRLVIIDLMSTVVVSRGRDDLRVYRTAFDYFRSKASVDIDPILDRYALRYADLARAAVRHAPGDH